MGRRGEAYCQYCSEPLDAGSVFVFLVEAQVYDEEVATLEPARASPRYHCEPQLVCKECRASLEQNRQDLLEEAALDQAGSRPWRRALLIAFVLFVLIFIIDGLWR
jgi:hypothetical protein